MVDENRKRRNTEVFISYNSADETVAEELRQALEARSIGCWKASQTTIPGGADYREKIMAALDECEFFVIILSRSSVESVWVRQELTEALRRNKRIYPIRIDDVVLDELFDFKLACSQISDGKDHLSMAVESLAIHIHGTRNTIVTRQKAVFHKRVNAVRFGNVCKLNRILFLSYLLTAVVVCLIHVHSLPRLSEISYTPWMIPGEILLKLLVLLLPFYVIVYVGYGRTVKRYAEVSNPDAMYLMYTMLNRIGFPAASKKKAMVYLKKAAAMDHEKAMLALSRHYRRGSLVEPSPELARQCEETAREIARTKRKQPHEKKGIFVIWTVIVTVTYTCHFLSTLATVLIYFWIS